MMINNTYDDKYTLPNEILVCILTLINNTRWKNYRDINLRKTIVKIDNLLFFFQFLSNRPLQITIPF